VVEPVKIVPKWIVKKELVDGKYQYAVYRRWLWWTKLHGRFGTKDEAVSHLESIVYPQKIDQAGT
jgi:hypothetical protein